MPTAWGTVMDVAGGYSGTLSGTMNMMGNLGGALYGPAAGWVLTMSHHNWNDVLLMGAAVYLTGILHVAGDRSGDADRPERDTSGTRGGLRQKRIDGITLIWV